MSKSPSEDTAAPAPAPPPPPRLGSLVRRDGTLELKRIGLRSRILSDVYHRLLAMEWFRFLGVVLALYLIFNCLFACAYFLDPGGVENIRPGSFADCFYFSVQTMATIGYGKMVPLSFFSHALVTLESLFGLMCTALMTGLVFAKFSRPTARILFSRTAVICMRDGVPSFIFRVCNERGNQVAEAQLTVVLFRSERTVEGELVRRFLDLPLQRQRSPMFALSWTAVHQIVPGSQLYGETAESLAQSDAEILVTMVGTDTTMSQTVHARHAYRMADVRWNERFVDIFGTDPTGQRFIDYRQFHNTTPVPPNQLLPAPPAVA